MKTFNIHIPPEAKAGGDHTEAIFLVDDKAWWAVVLPPVWLIWNRLWWALLVYVAVLFIIFMLLLTPFRFAVPYLSALPGLYLLLEGHELIRQKFERKGWQQIGVVQAANLEDAELRYFGREEIRVSEEARIIQPKPAATRMTISPTSSGHGLFPLDG